MIDARREAIVVESEDEDEGLAAKRDSTTTALLAVALAGVVERT